MIKLPLRRCRHHACLRQVGTVLLLAAALAYTFSFYLWTNLDDPYYWYNIVPFYREDFMQGLSLAVGHVWRALTGDNVLTFRLLGWLMGLLTMAIPYCSILPRAEWTRQLPWLASGLFVMGAYTQGMYNSDSLTALLLVVVATSAWKERVRGTLSVRFLTWIAFLSSWAVAARLPNLFVIPFFALYVWLDGRHRGYAWKKVATATLVYVGLSVGFYYVVMALLSGRWNVLAYFSDYLNQTDVTNSGHGLMDIVMMYWWSFLGVFWALTSLLGCYFLGRALRTGGRFDWLVTLAVVVAMYLSIHHFKDVAGMWSFGLMLLMYVYWRRHAETVSFWMVALFVALGFVACAGSNCGLYKIFPYYAAFSPLLLLSVKDDLRADRLNQGLFLLLWVCVVFVRLSGITQWHKNKEEDYRVNVTVYRNWSVYPHCTALFVDEVRDRYHVQMQEYAQHGRPDHTFFYGSPETHEMYALTNTRVPYRTPFAMDGDKPAEVDILLRHYLLDPQAVLFDYTDSPLLAEQLPALGYTCVRTAHGTVVWRKIE